MQYSTAGHRSPLCRHCSCAAVRVSLCSYENPAQTLDAKKEWNKHFELYIRELDKKKPVIWTGDLNVAPTALGMCGFYPIISHQSDGRMLGRRGSPVG